MISSWVVDDAGITFSFSKSLAQGYGLVPQPGHERVEGFSNPLWMLIMCPFLKLGLFDPYITPKILAALFMIMVCGTMNRIIKQMGLPFFYTIISCTLLAVNTPWMVWGNSGLENMLHVLLILLLYYFSVEEKRAPKQKTLYILPILILLLALSRPEGILWAVVPLAIFVWDRKQSWQKKVGVVIVICLLIFVSITLFRFIYFGDVLPNTYYAKSTNLQFDVSYWLEKMHYLSFSVGGRWVKYIFLALFFLFVFHTPFRRSPHTKNLLVLIFTSFLIFMAMPSDWMGELRFAYIFPVAFYLLLLSFTQSLMAKPSWPVGLVWFFFTLFTGYHFYLRTQDFMRHPTVPLAMVKAAYAERFAAYAEKMDIENPSVFLPDVGAMYYYSTLKVYDAGGLCNVYVAKNKHRPDLVRNYVLSEIKPSFIHLHGKWSLRLGIHGEKRFRDDYEILHEYSDSLIQDGKMNRFLSGDYVRKELISPQSNIIKVEE